MNNYLNGGIEKFIKDPTKLTKWVGITEDPIFKEAISLFCNYLVNQSVVTSNFNEMAAKQLEISGARSTVNFLTEVLTGRSELEEVNDLEPNFLENPYVNNNTNITTKPTTTSRRKSKQ